jgi:hypothetical protein
MDGYSLNRGDLFSEAQLMTEHSVTVVVCCGPQATGSQLLAWGVTCVPDTAARHTQDDVITPCQQPIQLPHPRDPNSLIRRWGLGVYFRCVIR